MNYTKIKFIFLLFIFLFSHANSMDISKQSKLSLLQNSRIYLDEKGLMLQEVIAQGLFKLYGKSYINIGMSPKVIWIEFTLHNNSEKPIQKTLVLSSPMLENISLYKKESLGIPILNGRANRPEKHTTLFYHYDIKLKATTSQQYYLRVQSDYTPVDFSLTLQDEENYLKADISEQLIAVMLVSIILALMLYNFLVSIYTRDKSYLYYSIYLFVLIGQQMSYLGLTQIYLPATFNEIDMQIPNLKGALLIVSSALFAISFLKIDTMPMLYKIYKLFISVAIVNVCISFLFDIRSMYTMAIIAIVYVAFTLIAGIISYLRGNRQARFFIAGFLLLFISYMMLATDALGITSVVHEYRSILAWATAIDALILSLAFADRYVILQNQKEIADQLILYEIQNREKIVQAEVISKTAQLNQMVKTKEILIKEVHHRVKNNLQLILSIIRLQNDEIEDAMRTKKLTNLENRVNAIAKTYILLLSNDNLEDIDMKMYIESLLMDIDETCACKKCNIDIKVDVNAIVPLKESVYVGLIINELVTNAYKYAFDTGKGIIVVTLAQNKNSYILTIEDNGKGYTPDKESSTLGLQLIQTLIYEQLEGDMEQHTYGHTKYIIRFSI